MNAVEVDYDIQDIKGRIAPLRELIQRERESLCNEEKRTIIELNLIHQQEKVNRQKEKILQNKVTSLSIPPKTNKKNTKQSFNRLIEIAAYSSAFISGLSFAIFCYLWLYLPNKS